ncbi:unnamed protein product [Effrenium voratum]|nr:unnamed protein product [Effrenium voratum]
MAKTSGRWIVDQQGERVKLACVNWGGAEVKDGIVGGLHLRSAFSIASTFREMGFNCVRFPWSVWMVQTDPAVSDHLQHSLLAANPELKGKSVLEILDAATCGGPAAGPPRQPRLRRHMVLLRHGREWALVQRALVHQ